MEQSNVNNLNGVSNFGHGYPDDVSINIVIPGATAPIGSEIDETKVEVVQPTEEVDIINQ